MDESTELVAKIVAAAQMRVWDLGRSRIGSVLVLTEEPARREAADRLLRATLELMQDAIEETAMAAFPDLTVGMCNEARRELRDLKADRASRAPTR